MSQSMESSSWKSHNGRMLGIGLDDIKEWNLHWGHGGRAFRKEVLFALYQSAVSHEKKQFKLTLKENITLRIHSLCNSYWGAYRFTFNGYLCDNTFVPTCTVRRQAVKLKGEHVVYLPRSTPSAEKYFLKDLLLDRQDLCNRWVMRSVRGGKK